MKCRRCGAVNARSVVRCWLCGQDPAAEPAPAAVPAVTATPAVETSTVSPARKYSRSFTLATIFLAMTLIAVCLGVIVAAPGLGIMLAIFSLPAFVRTGLLVQRRIALGKSATPGQKVLWFIGSLGAAVVVVVVVTVASVGTFCAVCLGAAVSGQGLLGLIGGGVALVLVLIATIRGMTKWTRDRWQRDLRQ